MNSFAKDYGIPRLDEYKKEIDRLKLLKEKDNGFYRDEANILCCVYIDRLSNAYNLSRIKQEEGKKRFCEILNSSYSKNDFFEKIYFRQLLINFNKRKKTKIVAEKISSHFNFLGAKLNDDMICTGLILPEYTKTYEKVDVYSLCTPILNIGEFNTLEQELWQGSIASIYYEFVRCLTVHNYTVDNLHIGDSKLDFNILYLALENIYVHIETLYLNSGKYFNFEVNDHPFSFPLETLS